MQDPESQAGSLPGWVGKEEGTPAVSVQLGEATGTVYLAANATHIASDCLVVRQLLLDVVLGQLHSL